MWELDHKESWMLKNWCFWGVGEDSWESLGLQGDQTNQPSRKSVLNIHWKDWCWRWSSSTLATWCKELTHWKRPWCWKRLKAGGEGDDRGWNGWMASSTRWTWVWASSGSWWWTGRPESDTTEQLKWTEEGLLWRRAWNPEIHLECSYSNLAIWPEWDGKLDFFLKSEFLG